MKPERSSPCSQKPVIELYPSKLNTVRPFASYFPIMRFNSPICICVH